MSNHILSRFVSFVLVSLAITLCMQTRPDTKLSPAEVISKHLESIGTPDARAKVHGTRIRGACTLVVKEGGSGQAQGRVLLSSQGDMNLLKMIFESEDNPTWFKFDGSKPQSVNFVRVVVTA
jgi:hypothetical protein